MRLYARIRFTILRRPFLAEIDQYLPAHGDVLDLGCGFGLFALYFAQLAKGRRVRGVDIDARRILQATSSATSLGLTNVAFEQCDVTEWRTSERFDAVYMLDLVHHLPSAQVPAFLAATAKFVKPGGVFLIKDIEDTPRLKAWFTLALDRLMVGAEPVRYRPANELSAVMRGLDFEVQVHRIRDVLPYPHILYICRRPG